jgi:hypothetical protein
LNTIIGVLRRLTGRPTPQPPAQPSVGQRIQEREQRAAKNRLLDMAEQRQAEYRYERRGR